MRNKTLKFSLFTIFALSSIVTFAQMPTISSFFPTSGAVGTLITITGTNLNSPTAFTIGSVNAIIISNDGTTLVGLVMPNSSTGIISITTTTGTATSTNNFTIIPTPYPSLQQGNKLLGTGTIGQSYQGCSVSISADGNTVVVGGIGDNNDIGAVWVYTRNGNIWTQQGNKLEGAGYVGYPLFGTAVAVSADGNTIIVGGPNDSSLVGAAWIFTRSGGVWSQQGNKLVGTGATGAVSQGYSVAVSADGNTIIVGGPNDSSLVGAAWIFTRSGGVWSQQGNKLVGTGATGVATQGFSVGLSADGNTAIVGGHFDNSGIGAAWIFTRNGNTWTQQGNKLVGMGGIGQPYQGISVALSADGNTAMIGGHHDNSIIGAAWVFTRSGNTWTQQGNKLVGMGGIGQPYQGISVALSADGNTAMIGGSRDNSNIGAAWVFTRSGGVWSQQGNKLVGTGNAGVAGQGFSVALSADGHTAIVGGPGDNLNIGAAWIYTVCPFHSTGIDTQTACGSYTWIDGNTYTSSNNTATKILTNAVGCDSVVTLNLTIDTINTATTLNNNTLIANQIGATYQWLDCNNGNISIINEIGQSFTPNVDGDYAVEITFNNCIDTSACQNVTGVGINPVADSQTSISPNPVDKELMILSTELIRQAMIYNSNGTLIKTINYPQSKINVADLPQGIYLLVLKSDKGVSQSRFVRQ